MKHIHGTPMSGSEDEAAKFLTNRDALVSFAHQNQMAVVADVCRSFVLDNGAYTIWKQGGNILDYYDKYIAFVETWHKHPGFEWAIIPDVIGGTEKENDVLLERWPAHLKGIPVYHNYLPIERLKKLADKYETVALGSSGQYATVGNKKWWVRMAEMMDAICDEQGRPACRLHGLRMLNPDIFTKLPLASADSTNVAQNSGQINRYGMYPSPKASTRAKAIAERIEMHNSAPYWERQSEQIELFITYNQRYASNLYLS